MYKVHIQNNGYLIQKIKKVVFLHKMFKKIFKNTGYLFVSGIISKALFLIQIIFIARYLGAAGLGKYAFVFAFGSLFFILSNPGLTDLATRDISRDKSKTSKYLGNLLIVKLCLCLVASLLMILTINLINASQELRISIYLICFVFSIDTFIWIFYSAFRAYEKMLYEALTLLIHNIVIVGFVLYFLIKGGSIIQLISAFVIGKTVGLIITAYFGYKLLPKPLFEIDLKFWKYLMTKSIPFLVIGLFILIIYRVDLVMLQFFKGEKIVGLYELAYTIIRNLIIFPMFFVISIYPSLSKNFTENKERLSYLYKKSFLYLFLFSLFVVICCFIFGKFVILLMFGKEFIESVLILRLISIGGFFLFLNIINVYYLNAINKPLVNVKIFIFGAVINIMLNLMLIPKYSYTGAAISSIISYFTIFVCEQMVVISSLRLVKTKKQW